jgi:hypothetical protein
MTDKIVWKQTQRCHSTTKDVNNFSEMTQLSVAFDQLLLYIEYGQLCNLHLLLTADSKMLKVSTQKVQEMR